MIVLLISTRELFFFDSRSLTRGDLDMYVVVFAGVLLTTGDIRRGINVICAREVNC